MTRDGYAGTLQRIRHALSGAPGDPVVGVSFIPEPAVRSLGWGVGLKAPAVTVVCSRLAPDFAFVEFWQDGASDVCEAVAACGTVPFAVVRGPLDAVATEDGWNETLSATVRDPDGLAARLDEATGAAVASVGAAAACGAGALVVADDLAGTRGPLIAPDFALAEVLPRLGRIARAAAEEGLPAIWHSDGDTRAFLASVAREGLAAVHPGALGPEPFRQLYGAARRQGIAVLGGLHGWALRSGVPSAIRAGVSASLIAQAGGLLVCDDGGVSTGEELGALIAAMQAARPGE